MSTTQNPAVCCDLVVLVADNDAEQLLQALLPRLPRAWVTDKFSFKIIRHPNRDNGCYSDPARLLAPFRAQARRFLVIFDLDGSGAEGHSRVEIEQKVENDLLRSGWDRHCIKAIAIEPELENWIWIRNRHQAQALNWPDEGSLFDWLTRKGAIPEGAFKPTPPKEWMIEALKRGNRSHSSAIFRKIAEKVSLRQALDECHDQSFRDLISTLQTWFPPSGQAYR